MTHELKMKVRDYECDLQGIVNNANYQHYFEHARHEFLMEQGVSFAKMHQEGIDAVVARIQIDFKVPLKSGDEFLCQLKVKKDGIKYVFHQQIHRLPDMRLACRAKVDTVCLINGKLGTRPELDNLTEEHNV
ncbi:MAG: acyl-CoA thioesterase [Bacteroidaceae bacterium]|nr:acyl-CoA thioesterase [Bacteroidaceae bacterium]